MQHLYEIMEMYFSQLACVSSPGFEHLYGR